MLKLKEYRNTPEKWYVVHVNLCERIIYYVTNIADYAKEEMGKICANIWKYWVVREHLIYNYFTTFAGEKMPIFAKIYQIKENFDVL